MLLKDAEQETILLLKVRTGDPAAGPHKGGNYGRMMLRSVNEPQGVDFLQTPPQRDTDTPELQGGGGGGRCRQQAAGGRGLTEASASER